LEKNKHKKEEYMKKMNNRKNKGKGKQDKSKVKCYSCQKMGHYSNECPDKKKKNKNKNAGLTAVESEVALVMKKEDDYDSPSIWIGDTGATSHMAGDLKGMFEVRQVENDIQIGNGTEMKTTAVGKYRGKVIQKDGTEVAVVLEDICYVPGIICNLFAITEPSVKDGNSTMKVKS